MEEAKWTKLLNPFGFQNNDLTVFADWPVKKNGGAKRIRTADLLNAIETLYQLSYSPTE